MRAAEEDERKAIKMNEDIRSIARYDGRKQGRGEWYAKVACMIEEGI